MKPSSMRELLGAQFLNSARRDINIISLGHFSDDLKVLNKLCQGTEIRAEILTRICGAEHTGDISSMDYEWLVATMTSLRKCRNSEKLYPAGKVYHICENSLVMNPVDKMIFSERKFHSRALDGSLHIPQRYDRALRRLSSSMSITDDEEDYCEYMD